MNTLRQIKKLFQPRYETLNRIEIIEKHILDNVKELQRLQPKAEIIPVLKSNAYGHGLVEMSRILNKSSVQMLAIDSFPEAQVLYKETKKNVLIIGEAPLDAYKHFDFQRTEFCVYNVTTIKKLASLKKKAKVHLFVNTGMNREGIQDLAVFLEAIKKYLPHIKITGLCSHLASAEEKSPLNEKQIATFFHNLDILQQHKIFPQWIHLGNSAGAFTLKDKRLTAFRTGIAVYGYNVFGKGHPAFLKARKLKPALRFISHIISVQHLQKGESVSYNETFKTQQPTTLATIPVGYTEGLDRRLSSKGVCYLGKKKNIAVKVAGRVCMNLTSLDVGSYPATVGEEVEVISEQSEKENSIERIAQLENTIPHEVLVKLNANVRRVIV